ncbi:hypothetical protein, partial [Bacillus licheniformis]|uniref:hypothetical protein n=2 Tax=Bacillaceae TaxID=186817 RepID=UPI002E24FE06|nr:hypothetical protein [Bacillus licheniformis]
QSAKFELIITDVSGDSEINTKQDKIRVRDLLAQIKLIEEIKEIGMATDEIRKIIEYIYSDDVTTDNDEFLDLIMIFEKYQSWKTNRKIEEITRMLICGYYNLTDNEYEELSWA